MHKSLLGLFVLIVIVLNACQPQPGVTEFSLTAEMSELQGTVLIKKGGSGNTQFAADQTLEANDQILTGDDGRVRLDLSTGSIIRIAPSSLFTLLDNSAGSDGVNANLKLDVGQIWIILKGGSIEVDTPSGVASVRGSYLMVRVNPLGGVDLTCLEGDCRFQNEAGEFFLTAGQTATIENFQMPPDVDRMTDEEVNDWLMNNPEAVVVIPSLTVTAVSTASLTPAPTNTVPTPTIQPTNTALPTATWIPYFTSTPSKPPKEDDPPPPPLPTTTTTTDPTTGWGFQLSNVDINGGNLSIPASTSFPVSFNFSIWNASSCPGCIDQLVVSLDSMNQYCAYDGIPALYPGTAGSSTGSLTAPASPGTYDIVVGQDLQYDCYSALNTTGFGHIVIGSITVP